VRAAGRVDEAFWGWRLQVLLYEGTKVFYSTVGIYVLDSLLYCTVQYIREVRYSFSPDGTPRV